MRTPFDTVIQNLQVISDLAEKEAKFQSDLILGPDNLGLEYGSAEAGELRAEPRPCEAALVGFLSALPDNYLNALCALLYTGRDGAPDPVAVWGTLRLDHRQVVQAIVEKTPRMKYINAGVARVADVNMLPGAL